MQGNYLLDHVSINHNQQEDFPNLDELFFLGLEIGNLSKICCGGFWYLGVVRFCGGWLLIGSFAKNAGPPRAPHPPPPPRRL
ncbi:MAG: hypothetical protein IPH74_13790 [Bacteroidetes bacterium]|nr:hypothetical protein [Bacteroidota bacterium]